MTDNEFRRDSLSMVIAHLRSAHESAVVAFYADGFTSKYHYTRAFRDLRSAANALGFDLVPRPADPVQPAATAEALYGVPV
jgi:hypothetical protein